MTVGTRTLGVRRWAILVGMVLAIGAQAEVMLQWFETEWDEIYRRMPEVAEFGYDYIWTPPPTKGPTGLGTKWGNVGYNLYDRFDIGDVPQRGSLATRYGTRGDLRNMVDAAHHCDVKIIPDIIMNHNGNGPDFRSYPGMQPEDFHVQWDPGHVNDLDFKRGPRMGEWYHGEGYGGTMWQELVSLIDIRTETDDRFTGNKDNNTPGWNFVNGGSYLRHVGQYDRYPYGYGAENVREMLNRWIAWLGNAMDYDGLRLDAGKHVPWEFFGAKGLGFLHEAQYNYNLRYNHGDGNPEEADELFTNYLSERNDALIFAEILSYQSELAYWFGGQLTGVANNTLNPMRFLDYPLKQKLYDAFSNGNLAALTAGGGGIDPQIGIMYAWGHDEAGPGKINLAYAYILTHVGFPMVYFTGNNITWADHNVKTWMRPGYDSQALADQYNDVVNLVWIHQQFARGKEYDRWNENDFFAYERYDDKNFNSNPDAGEGLLLVVLNDSGGDQTRNNVTVSFPLGTWLHDYSGHNPNDIQVYQNGIYHQVNVTVPGNYGQGWVCYAPFIAEGVGDVIQVTDNGSPAGTMDWIVPGGVHAADKPTEITRVTSTNLTLDAFFEAAAGTTNDYVAYKWGQGKFRTSPEYWHTNRNDNVLGHYQDAVQRNATNWYIDIPITDSIPEGLNTVKFRVFNQRDSQYPELFNTFTKLLYIDRRGPEIVVGHPAEGATVYGDAVMVVTNTDHTAFGMTVAVDGGGAETAHEIMRGLWKYDLRGLSTGTHTALVTTTEADWGSPREIINTSFFARVFNVVSNAQTIALNHTQGQTLELPFFTTTVTAPGGSPSRVTLYWDGLELPFNQGGASNVFNGEIVRRDTLTNVVTDRLWGAFVNGQHFFEAERVDGGVTSRVARRVTFNLYGINAIDSDGDALPDNVEMPFIDSDGAPGPDAPWPGDSNRDFVPNYGETWTRLNPYNHSTFYTGHWDDQNNFDGDEYSNGDEVLAGYLEDGNIYKYNIYDGNSHPTSAIITPSAASWTPEYAVRGQPLRIFYWPNQGPLENESPIHIHIGHSLRSAGEWQDVTNYVLSATATNWTVDYAVPSNATSVDFVFRNATGDTWDNNNGNDWQAGIQASTNRYFTMDGAVDSDDYLVHGAGMYIWAAAKEENLYVATWGTTNGSGGSDHFIYVTDVFGPASDIAPDWNKSGLIFCDPSKPYLAGEGESDWKAWHNISGFAADAVNGRLEGEINLVDAFGYVPSAVYVAAIAVQTWNTGALTSQGPPTWNSDGNVDTMEFLRVPIVSVTDDDLDGFFDVGKPEMWTVVGTDTNDANYGLRRFFINELAGDTAELTVILQPNVGGGNTVGNVELFSNVNRRDFAVLEEDPSSVTTNSTATYFRAYPMTDIGGGRFAKTLTLKKCGAYRINARYRVNGGPYVYVTDYGLRRDCAVVVSPDKALGLTLYELNPLIAEATNDNFYGRSTFRDMVIANVDRYDAINTNHFTGLGMNTIWLQPIHPIGSEGRGIDPLTGLPFDPGSPYAVRNYWKVNSVLGDPSSESNAMVEFQTFVAALDQAGVGVMLDGTFNHSAWDCEIGTQGVEMGITSNATDLIRNVRPAWYSWKDSYGQHAGSQNDIAVAPDRIDFGKWPDAADFYFGRYSALVQAGVSDTNNAWSSPWYRQYLREDDAFDGHDAYTREIWEYFAAYPEYWLEQTGHPAGTPKSESWKGIDGLRCDFAQGLPNRFWEYCINRTRSLKWDFIFMAESLDGYTEVDGSKRHGVGYRSARHFDVLNENFVFYWRNEFFDYDAYPSYNAQPFTAPTQQAFDDRRVAFDASPILLNLTSHDEIFPSHDPWRVFYAYAEIGALDGVPMLFYGQEAGAKNDFDTYARGGEIANDLNNFAHYEENFGKSIPNFKRYNEMTRIWTNRDWELQNAYGRVNQARLRSPALRSQEVYFLDKTEGGYHPDIFAVAKVEAPGVSAATQDVVLVFVNNNYWDEPNGNGQNVWGDFDVDADYEGKNRFGIESGHEYNLVDLASTNPAIYLWPSNFGGDHIIANGITVGLTGEALAGKQAQYLKLVDVNAAYPDSDGDGIPDYSDWDDDNDGLPDWWETANGLSTTNAVGDEGAGGDKDDDTYSNADEYGAGTSASNDTDYLTIEQIEMAGSNVWIRWPSKVDVDYGVERTENLLDVPPTWQRLDFRTALSNTDVYVETMTSGPSNRFYRVTVKP